MISVVLSLQQSAELTNVSRDMIPQQKEYASPPSVPQGKIVLNRNVETIHGPRHQRHWVNRWFWDLTHRPGSTVGMAVGSSDLYKLLGRHNHYFHCSSLLSYMLTMIAGSKNWLYLLLSSCKDSNFPPRLRWDCHQEKSIAKIQNRPRST